MMQFLLPALYSAAAPAVAGLFQSAAPVGAFGNLTPNLTIPSGSDAAMRELSGKSAFGAAPPPAAAAAEAPAAGGALPPLPQSSLQMPNIDLSRPAGGYQAPQRRQVQVQSPVQFNARSAFGGF